jgi:hypothetical protein
MLGSETRCFSGEHVQSHEMIKHEPVAQPFEVGVSNLDWTKLRR